jgi:hypothetical protein
MCTLVITRAVSLKALTRCVVVACAWLCVTGLFAQSTGDFRSRQSGNWTAFGTWERYNGTSWVNAIAGQTPTTNVSTPVPNVTIRDMHTVFEDGAGPYSVNNLTIEAGGRLWAGPGPNRYINIYGTTLQCDGEIGSGPTTFDQIGFNIDGVNVTIQGSGVFNASRLRKNFNANTTTNLTIAMDMNLLFNTASSAQIYNNYDGAVIFNVTINSGVTVNLTGGGNAAMDGVNGASGWARGGSYSVNGTLNISGTLFLTTNNTNVAQRCFFTIGTGGIVRAGSINATASGTAGHEFRMNTGSTLELTGTGPLAPTPQQPWIPYSATNNTYSLDPASTVIYSGAGDQAVAPLANAVFPVAAGYGNLRIAGSGTKSLRGLTVVKGNVDIVDISGSPVLDATNFDMRVGGNWTNYAETGFNEQLRQVQFNGGAATQTITTTGGERFYTMQMSKTGTGNIVSLGSAVRIANNINWSTNCILDLNGQLLTIANPLATGITIVTGGTSRHIRSDRTDNSSAVRWEIGTATGAHVVPYGTSAGYTPFTFNLVSGDAGAVTMSTYGTGADNLPWPTTPDNVTNLYSFIGLTPDNRAATVDRFWQVDVTGTPVADLTFVYRAAELPASPYDDPLSMRAQRWSTAAGLWGDSLEGNSVAYSATATNVDEFGPFTLTPISAPLPVELLSFDARVENGIVILDWATASERDNDFFTVMRSADAANFVELVRVKGAGDSWTPLYYSAVDDAPLPGLSYYKLRQTDVDGTWSESAVVPVNFNTHTRSETLFPNPVVDRLTIAGLAVGGLTIRIRDGAGRLLYTQMHSEGAGRIEVPMDAFATGHYLAVVEYPSGEFVVLPFVRH